MYYVVAKGKKPGIYLTWDECKKQVHKYSGAKYKKFSSLKDAENFYSLYNNGSLPKNKKYREAGTEKELANQNKHKNVRNCIFCGKPFKKSKGKNGSIRQGVICNTCKVKISEMNRALRNNKDCGIKYRLNRNHIVYIKNKYKCSDIFSFIIEHPKVVWDAIHNSTGQELGDAQKNTFESYKHPEFKKNDSIPTYVAELLGEDKEVISIKGDRRNPIIRFRCKRCDNCFSLSFNELKKHKGHDCSGLLSSGEAIVKDYLKKSGIKFLTQRDTLPCINPETGRLMPYDFEIPDRKIIIEVQGEQHRVFIERFHINEEGFEYQKKKDLFKKKYAEEKGYQVIELWYDEISSGKYKDILNNLLYINKVTM